MRSVKLCPRWERSETSRQAPLNVGNALRRMLEAAFEDFLETFLESLQFFLTFEDMAA